MGKNPWSSSNAKLNNENGGKGPPDPDPNGHASSKLDGNQNDDDPIPADDEGPQRFARYQPRCDITGKEAVSAITRAKSVQCKQELADVTCQHNEKKLYPLHLPRFCPFKGQGRGEYLGCHKDKMNERDMDGGFMEMEENSPDRCINHCIRGGFNYAGVQYGKECWCGESYGKHHKLSEEHCATPCPGQHNLTCGGYLAIRVFRTGYGKTVRQPAPLPPSGEEGKGAQVRIVFVLTLNGRQVRQVVRLLRTIYHPRHYYYIHVDSRQEFLFRELLPLEQRLENVMLTRARFATIWGGASLLQAHLAFLTELVDRRDWSWDYYINLSESDYPLKTVADLTRYLTAYKGLNFLKSHGKDTLRFIKKQGLDQTFYECENHLWRIGHRPLPSGVRVDGGSDWVCLHRDFAHYLVRESDELLTGLKALYKYTLLPAESFFHTVLQNSRFCGDSVDNNLHLTNWRRKQGCKCQYKHIVDWCGCSPNDFKITDLERLMKYEEKPLFFARKFEAVVNQEIINSLDVYLFGHLQQGLRALSSYWQNEFHHLDAPPKHKDTQLTFYHSFMRLTSALLLRRHPEGQFRPLRLLEVSLFMEGDHFHGLLVLFAAEFLPLGREVMLETHVHPKHYYTVVDSKGLMSRLQFLEVGSDFDPKELILRNQARLLGPQDEVTLRHVWGPGREGRVSVAWVDPASVIAVSYDILIPASTFVGSHKPALNRPLRPGLWTVKLMVNMTVVAETQFLVTPLTFHQGKPISAVVAQHSHNGPAGLYMSKDFSGLRSVLKVPQNTQLEQQAADNARKVGRDLDLWVDSLVPLFWVVKETCAMESLQLSASISECRKTAWSSRSPDPKSDIQTIGSKLAFGR
ncbi:hypothetical protein ACOMHN_002070 [Nucella lapillus]